MIELTTGVVFLLSSMYGAGNTNTDAVNVQPSTAGSEDGISTITTESDRQAVEKYLREHFADTPILVEIARCESTFMHYKNGELVRGRVDNADVGVMQINERYHLETATKLGYDIHTIEGNMAYARYLYGKSGTKPWNASKPCWEDAALAMN
jgi:hypothetical protein